MTKIVALLDRPYPSSFGVVPIVAQDGDLLSVLGVADSSRERVRIPSLDEVQGLVAAGHARGVDQELENSPRRDTVALWLGSKFEDDAGELGLPSAPLPSQQFLTNDGVYYLGPAERMYVYLERWIVRAFDRLKKEEDVTKRHRIASLMNWVLPGNEKTLAALWKTSSRPEEELELQLRTFAHGKRRDLWSSYLLHVWNNDADPLSTLRIVAFAGGSGTKRDEMARYFSEITGSKLATFVGELRPSMPSTLRTEVDKKNWLMNEGQVRVNQSPLEFALSVLQQRSNEDKFLVVDGLRHREILDVLRWLQEEGKPIVIGIEQSKDIQRRRVADKGEDPDSVLAHPTEVQIPDIVNSADKKVRDEDKSALHQLAQAMAV